MTAPIQFSEIGALGDIDDFAECCADCAWYYAEGWIALQTGGKYG
jgi:hypothetical protein